MALLITKADGTQEPFNPEKLIGSLVRAGAEHDVARTIADDIEHELYPDISTSEIYRHAFSKLRDARRGAAARYSVKRALVELGPSGFPFEAYLSELFRVEGATTEIDQIIQGECVEHEVDVVAHWPSKEGKSKEILFVEAKFHNTPGFKTDLKTVLYVKARHDDIRAARVGNEHGEVMRGMVATNTKFTSVAAQYAACAGVEILSWEEPVGNTLQDRIEAADLYPVTALTTLSRREKLELLRQKIVLAKTLQQDTRALSSLGITGIKAEHILEEIGSLCRRGGQLQ